MTVKGFLGAGAHCMSVGFCQGGRPVTQVKLLYSFMLANADIWYRDEQVWYRNGTVQRRQCSRHWHYTWPCDVLFGLASMPSRVHLSTLLWQIVLFCLSLVRNQALLSFTCTEAYICDLETGTVTQTLPMFSLRCLLQQGRLCITKIYAMPADPCMLPGLQFGPVKLSYASHKMKRMFRRLMYDLILTLKVEHLESITTDDSNMLCWLMGWTWSFEPWNAHSVPLQNLVFGGAQIHWGHRDQLYQDMKLWDQG